MECSEPRPELWPEFLKNHGRELILQGKKILRLGVESLGPYLVAVGGLCELDREANILGGAAQAAIQHQPDSQALADLAQIRVGSLELERRTAGYYAQSANSGEPIHQLFCQPVTEVFVLGVRANVGERQHHDAALRILWRCRGVPRCGG
jgi:hypothetical protein